TLFPYTTLFRSKESLTPCPLALAERVQQAAHEREQRHALELHAAQLLSRFLLALRQAFVAVGGAETLRGERRDDQDEADVGVGERGAVAVGAQKDRADRHGPPRDGHHGDRF